MAKSENQKLKILYIAKYFLEYSDENHPLTAEKDICDYLKEEYGIDAERRSVYRDIALLRDVFGMDIDGGQGGRYRLMSRQFDFDELRLLAECVYSAKFISESQARNFISTLGEFCSVYQAEKLESEVFLCDRVKTKQKGTMTIISEINAAMSKKQDGKSHTPQKITFKYLKSTIDDVHSQKERKNGNLYKVSPYKLLINDGNYYLLAFDSDKQDLRTYRIDRMKEVNRIDEPRDGEKEFAEVDLRSYTRRVFSMYGGKKERVTIRFINPLLDTAIERFGTSPDVFYMPKDKNHFIVSADVEISDQFFGWLCGFGNKAKIESPDHVVEQMKEHLNKIQNLY
ncbi:MAG: WYL domain-containing protein [Ruminococcaceae bacterium]|nr:WYL domain-containing protein [Oscillospiraceae bacterium]